MHNYTNMSRVELWYWIQMKWHHHMARAISLVSAWWLSHLLNASVLLIKLTVNESKWMSREKTTSLWFSEAHKYNDPRSICASLNMFHISAFLLEDDDLKHGERKNLVASISAYFALQWIIDLLVSHSSFSLKLLEQKETSKAALDHPSWRPILYIL